MPNIGQWLQGRRFGRKPQRLGLDLWRGSKKWMVGNGMITLDMTETVGGRLQMGGICNGGIGIERDVVFDL